jgi:hypothetical protein
MGDARAQQRTRQHARLIPARARAHGTSTQNPRARAHARELIRAGGSKVARAEQRAAKRVGQACCRAVHVVQLAPQVAPE